MWRTRESLAVWKVLHEEVRAKRQGRSTLQQQEATPPRTLKLALNSLGDVVATKPGKCFWCGEEGHWASDRPKKGGSGGVQQVGENRVWVSTKGVAWDLSKPPSMPCLKCRQMHWSQTPPWATRVWQASPIGTEGVRGACRPPLSPPPFAMPGRLQSLRSLVAAEIGASTGAPSRTWN